MRTPTIAIAALSAAILALSLPSSAQTPPAEKPPAVEPKKQDPAPTPPKVDPAPAAPKGEPGKTDAAAPDAAIAAVRAYIAEQSSGDAPKIDKKQGTWKSMLPKYKSLTFTAGKNYFWNLETSEGAIQIRFRPDVAPEHVANFIYLTELGFFDGLSFHRVIPAFMAQGGCPNGDGRGNPGYRFPGEFPQENGALKVKHDKGGLLSMANSGPGTDGSQFFITFKETPWLDGKHTIFGEVSAGMDIVKKLEQFGSAAGVPSKPLKLAKATITVQ